MPRLIIDEQGIEVPAGTRVIAAAEQLGIMIPRFCYHQALGAVGACRMCALKFEAGPVKGVEMSCMVEAVDDMVVSTTAQEAVDFRRQVIEWLMANHPHDCLVCDEGGQCLLQDETVSGGHGIRRYPGAKRTYMDQDLGPFVQHEMNRCIHCYRCVRFYQDFAGYRDLGTMRIGSRVYFGRFRDGPLESPFAGNLVDICPTGVFTDKTARYKARPWDLERASSVCVHCSLGCHTTGSARYRAVIRQEARFGEGVNGHFICDRGRFGFSYVNLRDRPRRARIGNVEGVFAEALQAAGERLTRISRDAGPEAIACLGSTRSSLETLAMLRHLCEAKGWRPVLCFIDPGEERKAKTITARLDHELAVSLRQIERADCIVAVGVDPINEAPMLAMALRQAARKGAAVMVIDPRPVALPFSFDHLAVVPWNLETCLCVLIKRAVTPEDAVALGPAALDFLAALPDRYPFEPLIGDRLSALAQRLRASRNPVIVCGTDIVFDTTLALVADHGRFLHGIKGAAGLFYVLPSANSFGAALVAGAGERSFPDTMAAIESGVVKALLVVEADPFRLYPDQHRLARALDRLELLVVLDYLPSETVGRAHIFLPTTTVFETGGSLVNQEGRIQYARPVYGGGMPISQLSDGSHPPRLFTNTVPDSDPKAAWQTVADLGRAMSYPNETSDGRPWKALAEAVPALANLTEEAYPLDDVRILPAGSDDRPFGGIRPLKRTEPEKDAGPDDRMELLLADWTFGTEELSSYAESVRRVEPEPYLAMHRKDAMNAGLADGDRVVMHLDRGVVEVRLRVFSNMAEGIMILPRHRQLAWQQVKVFGEMVPLCRIEKA